MSSSISTRILPRVLEFCDKISIADALENGWVSEYRNYKVLIDVDMSEYEDYNAKFQQYFAYFVPLQKPKQQSQMLGFDKNEW